MFVDFIVRGFEPDISKRIVALAAKQNCDVNKMIKELIAAGLTSMSQPLMSQPLWESSDDSLGHKPGSVNGAVKAFRLGSEIDDNFDEEVRAAARLIP